MDTNSPTENPKKTGVESSPSQSPISSQPSQSSTIKDVLLIIIGSIIMTIGMVAFSIPNKIASGGLTGFATILFYVFGLPVGMIVLLGNLILIAIQYKMIGFKSVWKTILAVALSSIMVDTCMKYFPFAEIKNPFLACLYGGLLGGAGVGIVFRAGGTTGGVDIVGQLLQHKYHFPVGDSILAINFMITLIAGAAFGPELALYGLISAYLGSFAIDAVLEGMTVNRSIMIITRNPDELSWAIMEELHRGVTAIDGRGMYTNKPTTILMVAVRRMEMTSLRRIVYEFDPNAFIIVGDARQVLGKGFIDLAQKVKNEI
ncbi:MAG: YitT family protein [Candidatus Riflebacteria bacterium]|nr:YitT family protein [Candidatus Riflebacteria bacterium]